MARVLHIYAHPGHGSSRINAALWRRAEAVAGVTHVDLFARYPRYRIDIDAEQTALLAHDVVVLQFPLFWYSCPALLKEWIDLTLEHGFAYGHKGDKLKDKTLMLAITAGGPEAAYSHEGYQNFPLRAFLTPFEQTATLCQMRFLAPYVLYGALGAGPEAHAAGFQRVLEALRDDTLDLERAAALEVMTHDTLPIPSQEV